MLGVDAPYLRSEHEVVTAFATDAVDGLTEGEARDRASSFGPNSLPGVRRRPVWRLVLDQFNSPLIYVLIAAGIATVVIGHLVDAVVIAGVLAVNAIVGVVQEARAGSAMEALSSLTSGSAQVVRDGRLRRLPAIDLVPGDLVDMQSGDRVPADVRLVESRGLRVDEASLTGESLPVHKSTDALEEPTPLADRTCMAFAGTLITSGRARGIVVRTGTSTEVGAIHALMKSTLPVQTPLTRQITRFSRLITVAILALAVVTFALGVARGESPAYMVTAAVALAVGAIPEGLPAAVTITLAIGVSRMARRRAVIRRLPAVETLGSVTVICTDKTGTLTENRMSVQSTFCFGRWWPVGPAPLPPAVRDCLLVGALCNNATLGAHEPDGAVGDPMEVALLEAARRAAPDVLQQAVRMKRVQEIPFSAELRLMATVHATGRDEPGLLAVKGAVEEVTAMCAMEGWERSLVDRASQEAGDEALRVIALARSDVAHQFELTLHSLRQTRLRFVGLVALQDPPRPAAVQAVGACRAAGIDVTMVTGDHERTARAIAEQVGIAQGSVYARVTAEQKLEIVRGLQARGHVVAMTGDGVNDAPALKQADIGVAMGDGGTEVAKEAADMVILDDDFATIEAAVEEGRTVFDNLVKFIVWTLPTNFAEGLVVLAAVALGVELPILPLQILWINTVTAVALGVMLAFEPAEPDIMRRSPRPPGRPLIERALLARIVIVGAVMLLGAFGAFLAAAAVGLPIDEARTVAVNAFVAMEIAYLLACRSLRGPMSSVGLWSNPWIWLGVGATVALQLALTYSPFMNEVFDTAQLDWDGWVIVLLPGPVVYLLVSLIKRLPGASTWIPRRGPGSAQTRPLLRRPRP